MTNQGLENQNLPLHVGIIMDGNRRWAKQNGLPVYSGHSQGAEVFKSLAFKNENDDWHQLCKKPWYSQTYDSALYMNRFMIKPIHFQFYTLAEFSGDFSVNYHEVKKHFMRLLFNALKQNDLYILPINANLIQKYIPKINSLEELLILSDIN